MISKIQGPLTMPPYEGMRGLGKNRKFYTHIPINLWNSYKMDIINIQYSDLFTV